MMRFLLVFSWVVGTVGLAAERPNVVFFFVDDQTASSLGCYGHPLAQTPRIDRLAAEGTLFRNAFVSQPICWVSRSTVLTGRTGRSFGGEETPDQPRPELVERLYSDLLREVGYRTGFFGKWHTKMPPGNAPASHFDEFEDISRNPFFKRQADGSLIHETDLIVDRGIEFLRSQPGDKPFALNLWFNACHAEDGDRRPGIGHFAWPQSANGLYEDQEMYAPKLNDPEIFERLPMFFKTSITRERYFWRWNTEEKYQTNMRAYLRMVSGIDHAIGRLMTVLEEMGVADNTVIVYSADNGYHMANRGLAGKWSHFDESIRVPLIVMDPRVAEGKKGQVTEAFALNEDLPATFLDLAGVAVPEAYEGRSLRPVVEEGRLDGWREATFHEHFAVRNRIPAWEGVRTAEFKYARYFDHDYEFLHDLKKDPDELENVAGAAEYAAVLTGLRAQTEAHFAGLGGPLPPLKGEFQASTEPHPVAAAGVTVKARGDGFIPLFNGRNLQGWSGDPAYWSVEDGVLTGRTDGSLKMNRFLSWNGSTVRNFELRVKVKISAGGNSGLQYRGVMRPEVDLDIVSGYQCDVVANRPDYHGMLYEERGRRILAHTGEKVVIDVDGQPWVVGQMPVKTFAADEWQDFRVVVRGNYHQHWVNGQKTVDVIDLDEKGRVLDGVLAVQVHVGPAMVVQYKDFLLKPLPDDLPLKTAAEVVIPADARGVRPQGKLPADWVPPVYGERAN